MGRGLVAKGDCVIENLSLFRHMYVHKGCVCALPSSRLRAFSGRAS